MPAYLVRTIDEHDLVGFFYAEEMDDLIVAVDECTGQRTANTRSFQPEASCGRARPSPSRSTTATKMRR